jgi:hypothetical protein
MFKSLRLSSVALIALAAAILLTACGPEKKLWWSADGDRAAIVSSGKLYLCDERGELSGPLAEGVECVAWFPDSRRIAIASKREIDNWEELVKAAPADFDEKKVIATASDMREELLAYDGELDDFKPSNARQLSMQQWMAAAFYLSLQEDPRLKNKIGDQWKDFDHMKVQVSTILVMATDANTANGARPLFSTLNDIVGLSLAPDGAALACVTSRSEGWAESEVRSLLVLAAEARDESKLVADHVSAYPDWSGDSRALVFVRREAPDSDSGGLGIITRQTVRDEKGALLRQLPEHQDLVAVLFRDTLKFRCLGDGRLLVAAAEVTLPAGIKDLSHSPTLFTLNPAEKAVISRLLPRSADSNLPDRADLFELSPDQKHVAIPGNKGRISVVTLATGEVTEVIDTDNADSLRTIPVWRNSDQLCLVAPANSAYASSQRAEVILWSRQKTAAISRHWPDALIDGIK